MEKTTAGAACSAPCSPNTEGQFDVIVIGAGPGGYRAAEAAAKGGLKVAVVEAAHVGGTCLNEGCIPTKSFARSAEVAMLMKRANEFGLTGEPSSAIDLKSVVERKNNICRTLRSGVDTILSHPNITVVRGEACLKADHTVEVLPVDKESNFYIDQDDADLLYSATSPLQPEPAEEQLREPQLLSAPNIIIATGSEAKIVPFEVHYDQPVADARLLLEVEEMPEHLCIIGAGVIGMEFASIFNAFGCKVHVIEFMKECLPMLDADIAKRLRKQLEKRGVEFFMESAAKEAHEDCIVFERKGKRMEVSAELTLAAVGRTPLLPLGLEEAGVSYDKRRGITVDDNMLTSQPGIYAIGDVNGRQMLAHAAEMQAQRAVNHILGRTDNIRLDIMPSAIFTLPEAACVGPGEQHLKATGTPYECHKAYHRANGKALSMGESEGMLKLLSEPGRGRILGCHAFGPHAADMVQEVSVLMCRDTTVEQLSQMVHIHPTLSELVLAAAEA